MMDRDYYLQNFYFISDRLQYTIRGEVVLHEPVDGMILQHAADTAFQRYPYFSVSLEREGEAYVLRPNHRPQNVMYGEGPVVLGSEEVNRHLVVISWFDNKIIFHVSHSITDGAGRSPLTKTVLYYYLTEKYGITLDPEGIRLAGTPLYEDEEAVLLSEEEIMKAQPVHYQKIGHAYKLRTEQAGSSQQQEFRFRVREDAFMNLCRSFGTTPNSLISVLLAQSAWKQDPEVDQNVVVNLCLNMRPALQNQHSHQFLLACIPLQFEPSAKDTDMAQLCQSARSQIRFQSDPENVRYLYQKSLIQSEKIRRIRKLSMKKKIMQSCVYGEEGFLSATFLASYVGRSGLNSLAPYVKAMYTSVDAIPKDGVIVEITAVDGYFDFTWLQDFTGDLYVKTVLEQLAAYGVTAQDFSAGPLRTPRIQLPEEAQAQAIDSAAQTEVINPAARAKEMPEEAAASAQNVPVQPVMPGRHSLPGFPKAAGK